MLVVMDLPLPLPNSGNIQLQILQPVGWTVVSIRSQQQ
tara:strand:- start:311 stop:424 length:114 start_codon:yes stop_codon:yes gene_type:complete